MVQGELETTNLLLGIMAAVSVLEALLVIGLGVGAYVAYRRVMALVTDLETRHVVPLRARVEALMDQMDAILEDVKDVTGRVSDRTERVDAAIQSTIHRVDETADRVKHNVRAKATRAVGVVHGLRAAIEYFLTRRQAA